MFANNLEIGTVLFLLEFPNGVAVQSMMSVAVLISSSEKTRSGTVFVYSTVSVFNNISILPVAMLFLYKVMYWLYRVLCELCTAAGQIKSNQ